MNIFNVKKDLFYYNEKYLYYVGLWPTRQSTLYKIYEITLHVLAITYVIITGIGTCQCKNTLVLMSNLDKILVAYNFGFKVFFFILNRSKLQKLIVDIKYSNDKVSEARKRFMASHIILITILCTVIVSMFCFLAQYHGEMTVELWVPFDPMESQMNLILANQITAITFVVPHMYRAFAVQGIVCTIIMYICDQLDELQARIRSLVYSVDNESAMRVEFTRIIKKHVRLMRYSNTFTNIFKEFFLIQNLAVTIELCLNALMVTSVGREQKTLLANFIAFLLVALLNAYIFCYLGDQLIEKSEGLALAAYESSWTSWPVDLQKDLLIVIRSAQRPLKLSAGGIATMCIQTYSQALTNAYSIFAVLNDVVE